MVMVHALIKRDLVQVVMQITEHDPQVVDVSEFYRHEPIVEMVS